MITKFLGFEHNTQLEIRNNVDTVDTKYFEFPTVSVKA